MMAVLEQRVFDGLGAADEQAAIETVLFLGDPLAAAVSSDENDVGRRTARGRFDELHVGIPSDAEASFSIDASALLTRPISLQTDMFSRATRQRSHKGTGCVRRNCRCRR